MPNAQPPDVPSEAFIDLMWTLTFWAVFITRFRASQSLFLHPFLVVMLLSFLSAFKLFLCHFWYEVICWFPPRMNLYCCLWDDGVTRTLRRSHLQRWLDAVWRKSVVWHKELKQLVSLATLPWPSSIMDQRIHKFRHNLRLWFKGPVWMIYYHLMVKAYCKQW